MESPAMDDETLLRDLNAHPHIKNRLIALLGVAKNSAGDLKRADDAEMRVIEEVRRMGQSTLQAWAENRVVQP